MSSISHDQIATFCASIGDNPLLVQGSGGNVSWKDENTLWVKASGMWLAHAEVKSIFVPVDLIALEKAISLGNFLESPRIKIDSPLRPSIETILHALLPHPIVVHIHAIEVLSFLVLRYPNSAFNQLQERMNEPLVLIPYRQPGAELASTIVSILQGKRSIRCLLLQNHGVVLGASSISEIYNLINSLRLACQEIIGRISFPIYNTQSIKQLTGYLLPEDPEINTLSLNPEWYKRLKNDWVLFPDHAVFLGSKAFFFSNNEEFYDFLNKNPAPQLVFIKNEGVYYHPSFTKTQKIQLRCYLDLLQHTNPNSELNPLGAKEISNLLNWDAEKFRQQHS